MSAGGLQIRLVHARPRGLATFVQTRAHGADADLAFCRDLTPRLYRQCDGDQIRHRPRFRNWIEQGFF
jgi:hypothetical protein